MNWPEKEEVVPMYHCKRMLTSASALYFTAFMLYLLILDIWWNRAAVFCIAWSERQEFNVITEETHLWNNGIVLNCNLGLQWNLWNKDTAGPYKSVLISEVSLIWRFPYNSCNVMLYNSGPWTLVRIVEVSVIGGVRFRRFHCNSTIEWLVVGRSRECD